MQVADGEINCAPSEMATNAADIISLWFDDRVSSPVRARISYAFRVFAAIYNYRVVETDSPSSGLRCIYTQTPPRSPHSDTLYIPARYQMEDDRPTKKQLAKYDYAGQQLYLAYGLDASTGNPDWLGEIFDWLSCSHEMAATGSDAVGRIPYSETVFGRLGITPRKPYASLLMAWMENTLRNGNALQALAKAPSPVKDVDHIVLPSHDIDFCYTTKTSALIRLLKNIVISCSSHRSASFFADNSRQLLELSLGKRVGDYLQALMLEMERQGFRSTFFAVARHGNRRDPNYQLAQISSSLIEANRRGFPVNVHGSYCSMIEDATLHGEAETLSNALGKYPRGGRQHWLRFNRHETLFSEVTRAGLIFDSTLGFAENVGFRNGASFAYPPYDFEKEAPFNFLEFPLALMDGSLQAESRISRENPQTVADEILGESRKWGWGGISILWHNPIEPIQVPREINQVFWSCAEKRSAFREAWMTSDQLLPLCLSRFHNAGLLKEVTLGA